jgi:hypothetical protein
MGSFVVRQTKPPMTVFDAGESLEIDQNMKRQDNSSL